MPMTFDDDFEVYTGGRFRDAEDDGPSLLDL